MGAQVISEEKKYFITESNDGNHSIVESVVDTKIVAEIAVGPQGPANTSEGYSYTTGESISAYRLVIINPADGKLYKATNSNLSHANSVLGITEQAANISTDVNVRTRGVVENTSWNWGTTPKQLYLGLDGVVTDIPPTSGFSLVIGFIVSATKIFIDLGLKVIL